MESPQSEAEKAGDEGNQARQEPCIITTSPINMERSLNDPSFLHVSLQSLVQEMTIEEAVEKVKELMLENQELREILHQNNDVLRNQHQTLVTMKQKQEEVRGKLEQEQDVIRRKFDEARDVVLALREEVQAKNRLLDELQKNLKDQFEIITKTEISQLEDEELKNREAGPLNSEEKIWQSQYDQLLSSDYHSLPATEQSDLKSLVKKLQGDLVLATHLLESQKKIKERLELEKRELIAMNNALTSHMSMWMSTASSPDDTQKSDVLFDREKELAKLRQARERGEAVEDLESVSLTSVPKSKREICQQKEQQMVQQLLLQMQEERDASSKLHSQLSEANCKVVEVEQELDKMRQALSEKNNEMAARLTELSKQHQAEIEEMLQKKATDMESASVVEKQSLQQQVVSLASEMKQAYKQLEDSKAMILIYRNKLKELQEMREAELANHERFRFKTDEQIKTINLANLTLQTNRQQLQNDLAETQKSFDQLLNDYHNLRKQHEDLKKNTTDQRSMAEQYHTTSVRLAAAQEALAAKGDELVVLRNRLASKDQEMCNLRSRLLALESEVDTIPVLKTQVEIYRCDFEAEREARERQHEEKERLKEDLQELHRRNQQLLDEMQSYASNQFAEMRRQHGYMSYSMGAGGESQPTTQTSPLYATTLPTPPHLSPGQGTNLRFERMKRNVQNVSAMETLDNAEYVCPKCRRKCPDFDTLTIHVNECLDEDTDDS